MSTHTALGHSFPTPCKRCGGALYRQVDYCPYCGAAHPLDENSYRRTSSADSRTGAFGQVGQKFSDAQATPDESATVHAMHPDKAAPSNATPGATAASPHVPLPPYDDKNYSPYAPRNGITFRQVLIAIAVIVVIGLAFVAYALFSDTGDSDDAIDEQTLSTAQDARTTTGTIAPFAPTQSNRPTAVARPSAQVNVAKITPPAPAAPVAPAVVTPPVVTPPVVTPPVVTAPVVTAPVVRSPAVTPPVVTQPVVTPPVVTPPAVAPSVAATPARPAPQFRDVTQALQAARLAFRANDLSAAQAALGAALAMQPGNSGAQDLASELRPLTARRDSALQAAQTCIAQQSWSCAREHANAALTIDTGNDTARTILERVIRETGWAPLNPRAAATAPAQGKPLAQAQVAAGTAAAPANSVDAHERAIKDSGWTRGPSNGGKASPGTAPRQ